MLIGFQKQFKQKILDSMKMFTIRLERKDKRIPKIGEPLYMYTGLRTKQAKRIFPKGKEPICKYVYPIEINDKQIVTNFFIDIMKLEKNIIYYSKYITPGFYAYTDDDIIIMEFIKMDGFNDFKEWYQFFKKTHQIDKKPFFGNIIGWGVK